MSRKVRLQAPVGTDEANFGTERFRVDNDGTVEVPVEAASALEAVGGFVEISPPSPAVEGHCRVMHDDEHASCSFGGRSFDKHADGSYHVPLAAVSQLISHGFVAVDQA